MASAPSTIELEVGAHAGVLVEGYRYSSGAVLPLEPHAHGAWQLAWSPDSVGEHWLGGALRAAPPGAISVVPPGEVHAPSRTTWLAQPATFLMAYLDESLVGDVASELGGAARGTPSFGGGVLRSDARLSGLFTRAYRASLDGEPLERDGAWLACLTRLLAHAGARPPAARREPRAVSLALDLLAARARERVTLAELARAAELTPARLCRAFAQHVGLPPYAYQLRLRIEGSKRLLLQGRRVADVAAATGFADQSHFGRHFKRIVGTTPSRYQSARR